jgi:hypothetical protein
MGRACSMYWDKRDAYRILVEKSRKNHKKDLKFGGRIIIKWILNRIGLVWPAFVYLTQGTGGDSCQQGNKTSCSIKY